MQSVLTQQQRIRSARRRRQNDLAVVEQDDSLTGRVRRFGQGECTRLEPFLILEDVEA